ALVAAGMFAIASLAQATVVDLINNDQGSFTNQYGTTVIQFTQPQPTGTGYIDPFLRVQANGAEQGYNTSGGTPFDDQGGPSTHDIHFCDLQGTAVTKNGTLYYRVRVDLSEPNDAKYSFSDA